MTEKYDEEIHTYLILDMYNAKDVAENGELATFVRSEHDELPSPDIIATEVKKKGYDTFEVTHVTEKIMRYMV